MGSWRSCGALLLALAMPTAGSPGIASPVPTPELVEHAQARVYAARVRFEPATLADRGRCRDLGADDLRVSLGRGAALSPSAIELSRDSRPVLHALVLDTSRSLGGKLDRVRAAAAAYVEQLRPESERALVVTFDDSVLLAQAVTDSHARLLAGIDHVRLGASTALHDGLIDVLRELQTRSERPVLVLLTDGEDTSSIGSREDVLALVESLPELSVFVIGLAITPLTTGGPEGSSSTRRFLNRLASRARGRVFDAPTTGRVADIYASIREMLDSEFLLTAADPAPESSPGVLHVASRRPGCRVGMLSPVRQGDDEPALPLTPLSFHGSGYGRTVRPLADPPCASGSDWFAVADPGRIRGCVLDATLDYGVLYDPYQPRWIHGNEWVELRMRPFAVSAPPPDALPVDPAAWLDALAETLRSRRTASIDTHWSRFPERLHARPFHDLPALVSGRTFFDIRLALARAFALYPDYRRFALGRLLREATEEMDLLQQELRRGSAGRPAAEIAEAARDSPEGRRIRERAAAPAELDFARCLTAWLGDISAHDLFVAWERRRIERWLAMPEAGAMQAFVEDWRALRRVFFAPSYARVLALLAPVHDREADRIGFWRIVLPRPAWLIQRAQGHAHHPDFTDLPLDLVPDWPGGLWLLARAIEERPELRATLTAGAWHVTQLRYALEGKPYTQSPERAFRAFRVTLTLSTRREANETPAEVVISASVRLDGNGDAARPVLERWLRPDGADGGERRE